MKKTWGQEFSEKIVGVVSRFVVIDSDSDEIYQFRYEGIGGKIYGLDTNSFSELGECEDILLKLEAWGNKISETYVHFNVRVLMGKLLSEQDLSKADQIVSAFLAEIPNDIMLQRVFIPIRSYAVGSFARVIKGRLR